MKYRWMAITGQFDENRSGIVFRGRWDDPVPTNDSPPEHPIKRYPAIGVALSDQVIADGSVSAEIMFDEIGRNSGCEFVVGFDIESRSYVTAGISGFPDAMYSIREWVPWGQGPGEQPRWIPYAGGGDRVNLKPRRRYFVRADVSGSKVELSIDGVPVAAASVPPNPKRRRHLGLWCCNHADIAIDKISVQGGRPRAFIIMQFSDPYDQVYSEVVRAVCDNFNLTTIRADEIYGPGLIISDVVDQLQRAQVVIADISPVNANVYFEVGYALALNKPIILLAKRGTELPFDVKAFRVLFYDDTIAGKAKVEEGLTSHLRAILGPE